MLADSIIVVIGLALAWLTLKQAGHYPGPYRRWLVGLRWLAIALAAVFVANPVQEHVYPDPDQFDVIVLVDQSASLLAEDLEGVPTPKRLDFVQAAIADAPESLIERLRARYQVQPYLFAGELAQHSPHNSTDQAPLPGLTAIGEAMQTAVSEVERRGRRPGALLLLSDGQNHAGVNPISVARDFAQRQLPISVIAVGERAQADVGIAVTRSQIQAQAERSMTIEADVTNTHATDVEATVTLRHEGEVIGSQSLVIAGNDATRVSFEVTAGQPGDSLYEVVLESERSTNQLNDSAQSLVSVQAPPESEVLYLADRLSPQLRFLQLAMAADTSLTLLTAIQTSLERLMGTALPKDNPPDSLNGFLTETDHWMTYDALIVAIPTLARLDAAARQRILEFVDQRGGGLLLQGDPAALPESLTKLLPIAGDAPMTLRPLPLTFGTAVAFEPDRDALLYARPKLLLPDALPAYLASDLKLGAVPLLVDPDGSSLLSAQAFGPGRTAYLGTDSTWQWRLRSTRFAQMHDRFWQSLLHWLASGQLKRIDLRNPVQLTTFGETQTLSVMVRTADFQPATDAEVTAILEPPEQGQAIQVTLTPVVETPGLYTADVTPELAGRYLVDYQAVLADEAPLRARGLIAVEHLSKERTQTGLNERLLRDLARMTQGDYYDYRDIAGIDQIAVSETLPTVTVEAHWTRTGWWVTLMIAVLCAEWFLRRRAGLR